MHKKQIVIIFIKNSEGDFFVHQRLSSKKSFPNLYGIGAGGHVDAGEKIAVAASRELKEETNLETPIEYLLCEDFDTPEDTWTAHLFITHSDDAIQNDESEWQWSGWMKQEEVDTLCVSGQLCPDTAVMYQKYLESI